MGKVPPRPAEGAVSLLGWTETVRPFSFADKERERMNMDLLAAKVSELAGFVWNGLLLYLLVGTGIIFTIRTRFIQVRKFGTGFRRLFGSVNLNGEKAGKEGMSSFQAVATSIAAQVGTGNITGCATAMISGGPGAIFWMWLAAFFGMATIYGEAVLAQTFKTKDETGHVIGGPVYYIRQAFKGTFGKILAGFFALAIIFALGFTGNMSPPGSWAWCWRWWPPSSSWAASPALPPSRRSWCPSWPASIWWAASSC